MQPRTDKSVKTQKPTLSASQQERYARQLLIGEIGHAGQKILQRSRVLVIGAGGLGSPALYYLACAGVGRLEIADFDRVEMSNLQRQILHGMGDLGRLKAVSAAEKIFRLNPDVDACTVIDRLDEKSLGRLVSGFDAVVEATDNLETKYRVNAACVRARVPFTLSGVHRFEGQILSWKPGAPCWQCAFGPLPETGEQLRAARTGILGATAGVFGALEAVEALKLLLGRGRPLTGRLLTADLLSGRFHTLALRADPRCPVCAARSKRRRR